MQQGNNFLKVNDQVEVITGKDKGRVGKIIKVYRKSNRALVERINMIKRHTKARADGQEGQIVEKEAPIHVSNLMLVCPKCTNTARIAKKLLTMAQRFGFAKNALRVSSPARRSR